MDLILFKKKCIIDFAKDIKVILIKKKGKIKET